jgi:PAS domain S-box-containing protein
MKRDISSEQRLQTTYRLLEDLHEAHGRYQRLVDALTDIIFEHDSNGLTFVSAAWSRNFGHDIQTSLGRPLRNFVLAGDQTLLDNWLIKTQETPNQSSKIELCLTRHDGQERWVDITGSFNPVDRKHAGIIRDITEQRDAQMNLIESERRFRELADSAPVMIWVSGRDTLCNYFNKFWLDFTGRTLEQELGNGWAEGIHPQDFDPCLETYLNAFEARQSFSMDYRLRRHDGEYRWIKDSGSPRFDGNGSFLGFIGSCVDVTAHKQAEDYFRRLVEASPIAMVVLDDRGRIELANHNLARMFGYGLPELMGQPVEALIPGRLRQQHVLERQAFTANPNPRQMGMGRKVLGERKDGSTFPAEVGLSPVQINDSQHVIAVLVDVTERQLTEQKVLDMNASLEQRVFQRTAELQEASAAKTKFLAHMSHEIRTPLNAVLGLAQLLSRELLEPGQKAMVRHIGEAGELLLHIVNDVLELSKIEAGYLSLESLPFSLSQVLTNVMHMMDGTAANKGLNLRISQQPDLTEGLLGDAMRLEQVLLNLLSNAIKFTDQGEITLKVQVQEADSQLTRLLFEIQDTGIGMDAAAQAKLFQPFSQADDTITRRFGGTGLGLSISKYLVELMGGCMGLTSELGQGSKFWFEIPFARPDKSSVSAVEPGSDAPPINLPPATQGQLSGLRVLIVDDSKINRMVVERALSNERVLTSEATNGQEALDRLREAGAEFDIVLMDIQMPVMDGLAATREIRQDPALSAIPVIALTAGVLPEEREEAFHAGIDDFLMKPVSLDQMKEVLKKYLVRSSRSSDHPSE